MSAKGKEWPADLTSNDAAKSISDPPPSYMDTISQQQSPQQAGNSQPSAARTLHVCYESLTSRTVRILDSDESTLLYEVDYRVRKPQISLRKAGSSDVLGTVKFHRWSGASEVELHDQITEVKPKALMSYDLVFASTLPAFSDRKLTWERRYSWDSHEYILRDDSQSPVAYLHTHGWSTKKAARFELINSEMEDTIVEEIIMTGLVVVQVALMKGSSAVAAAAAT